MIKSEVTYLSQTVDAEVSQALINAAQAESPAVDAAPVLIPVDQADQIVIEFPYNREFLTREDAANYFQIVRSMPKMSKYRVIQLINEGVFSVSDDCKQIPQRGDKSRLFSGIPFAELVSYTPSSKPKLIALSSLLKGLTIDAESPRSWLARMVASGILTESERDHALKNLKDEPASTDETQPAS